MPVASAQKSSLALPEVTPLDKNSEPSFRQILDGKAKPRGSLGRIEDVAARLGMIWHPNPPGAGKAILLIFAADHGMAAEVSQYPSAVTAAMVQTFLQERRALTHSQLRPTWSCASSMLVSLAIWFRIRI